MSIPNDLPPLPPRMKKNLERAIQRALKEAIKTGTSFCVVMFTAGGEVAMYQVSDQFRLVSEQDERIT